ncbi:lysophospholipase [Pullulanibacillus pueri]|uniref:Phospholipase YtpA n=1 Tax=Pullulanibacillus pueri TaxID=1437324 RepID=A0A8J2ZZI2_9BACL|nr:alpha/beta hydrolase [Pullulanibacillus pueri]MBM7683830.1 lysophospholipase [Pullulanibacillus pueri]GGH87749.1 phospholipase YtpA [Pullulanibacillus pueri]
MWVWKSGQDKIKGVVVIVHGAGEHHGRYEWLKKQWLEAGFHVVLGDLPGQGRNPKHQGHVDHFSEYITTVGKWIDTARTFRLPYILFGHSLGGLVVIRTLQEKRLKPQAVVLSSPCLGLKVPPPEWLKKAVSPLNILAPRFRIPIKRQSENILATHNKEILEKDATDPLIVKKVSLRWYFELDQAMVKAFQQIDRFPHVPLFILQAGSDKIVDKHVVHQWFNELPLQYKLYKEWPGFYHEIFNEPERQKVFQYTLSKVNRFFS